MPSYVYRYRYYRCVPIINRSQSPLHPCLYRLQCITWEFGRIRRKVEINFHKNLPVCHMFYLLCSPRANQLKLKGHMTNIIDYRFWRCGLVTQYSQSFIKIWFVFTLLTFINHIIFTNFSFNIDDHKILVEPSCGVSVAVAYNLEKYLHSKFKNIVVVVCGGKTIKLENLLNYKNMFLL